MRAQSALPDAIRRLAEAGVPDAPRDARRLLAHAMRLPPDRLTLHLADSLSAEHLNRFESAIAARARRQPVSQITGHRDFFGRSFRVTPDVLDPRPETEVLVLAALAQPFARVLDLGTGSGCILLTLLAERPDVTGLGTDLSDEALAVARSNCQRLRLEGRAELAAGNWYGAVTKRGFDLIVSNPPYIAANEMPMLSPEVRDWEPHMALTPGGDGLDAFRAIAAGALVHLARGGRLIAEIGTGQGADVAALWQDAGLTSVEILPDLDGRDRAVRGIAR